MFKLPKKWDMSDPGCVLYIQKFFGRMQIKAGKTAKAAMLDDSEVLELQSPKAWDDAKKDVLLPVLEVLLELGFERIPADRWKETNPPDTSLDIARFSLSNAGTGREYILGWRGDGRKVGQLKDAGGMINKAESEYQGYCEKINLRVDWNPLSLEKNRTDYFFRKKKSDNCLNTVVSISTDFKTAVTFPLLNADYIKSLPKKLPTEKR